VFNFYLPNALAALDRLQKSGCLYVSESVCHTKRVELSTSHNFLPIFTKLAIILVFQEL